MHTYIIFRAQRFPRAGCSLISVGHGLKNRKVLLVQVAGGGSIRYSFPEPLLDELTVQYLKCGVFVSG